MNKTLQNQLSEEEQCLIQAKLFKLLEKQTKKYTSLESTSLPLETGQALMDSILFTIGVGLYGWDYKGQLDLPMLLTGELETIFAQGVLCMEKWIEYGTMLWQKVCASLPEVENCSMIDTLKSIGSFFKIYNYRFFAQNIPCDIDYQLSIPISEDKQGILYVISYLERLATENHFLSHFHKVAMIPVLNRYCPEYRVLLINLYEPIVTNGIGCVLINKSIDNLCMTKEEQETICKLLLPLPKMEIEHRLYEAGEELLEQIKCDTISQKQLLKEYVKQLTQRIVGVRDEGGITGIFLWF